MLKKTSKILVAMSGGVDSSVAAALLKQQGHEVVGCFMRLGSPGETLDELLPDNENSCGTIKLKIGHQGCCSINDAADARLVAARLDIPFYVCNFKKDFGRIIDYFVDEYNAGRTPNPCVRCNDWLKFGKLHTYATQLGADFVASGHYAQIDRRDASHPKLLQAVDKEKDQSYVLFGAPSERLAEMLLPIGGYQKSEVRRLAKEFELPVFDKPDSQEICFVPDNNYAGLVKRRAPDAITPGAIVDTEGKQIGEHQGHQHFTVGQRRGIAIAANHPLYVISKDSQTNRVTVGERNDLDSIGCIANDCNWFIDAVINEWIKCTAKIRYNALPVPAKVKRIIDVNSNSEDEFIEVLFEEPQFAVAPGQAVVCYDADVVICGGWISKGLLDNN